MSFWKTSAAADLLGVPYWKLFDAIRAKKLQAPAKDSSGDYVWLDADLERAREALKLDRRRKTEGAANVA